MNKNVLCTGTFIVDIFNEPVKKALGPNEGVSTKIHTYLGGNSFNVAKDLINLNFSKEHITCVGAVGEDPFRKLFLDAMIKLGIKSEIYSVQGINTSKIFMLKVENEEPRYYFDEGANAHLPPDFVISRIIENKPSIFYTGETGNLRGILAQFPQIMKTAKSVGCLNIVDTTIPPNSDWAFLMDSKAHIDVLKCNKYEALSLTNSSDIETAIQFLSQLGIPLVIISLAEKGSIFFYNNSVYEIQPFQVPCIDSTGAGDAFNAGLIKSINEFEGSTLEDRLNRNKNNLFTVMIYASACGAAAVTENGCYDGVSENKITQLISEQGQRIMANIKKF